MQRLRGEAGYSLVEMVTVMAIMGVVFAGLTDVFTSASKADTDMQNRFTAQLNTRLALDKLRRDIHCAYDVSPNTPNPWTSSQSTLTLNITACGGGDVTWCTALMAGSTTRWSLYRQANSDTCSSSTGVQTAKYLTMSTPFTAFAHVSGCGCLASVGVTLPVGVNRVTTTGIYKLTDTIYLRNSTRI
jgi:prepilin-type N-terminal cleavage/methylation domain-containing protein